MTLGAIAAWVSPGASGLGHLEIRGPRPLRRKALGGSERGLGSPGNLRVGAFSESGLHAFSFPLTLGPSRVWVGPGSPARLGPDIPPVFFSFHCW